MRNSRFDFKAWHKPSNKMYRVVSLQCLKQHCVLAKDEKTDTFTTLNWDDCEILQCTGLEDDHNQVIFEADIIEADNGKFTIFYSEDLCQLLARSIKENYCMDIIDLHNCKVVGNIFEGEYVNER